MSFEQLKEEYKICTRCSELCKSRSQVVFGEGNPQARVLFIVEAPGATEDREGVPFCGMSGKILSELLAHIGLKREDIFITNTILCHPQDNRNPTKEEVNNCISRLDQLIDTMKPRAIVTIGNFATERILGKVGITKLRGNIFPLHIAGQEVKIVPVIHPASYLYSGRNPEMLKQMKSDFEAIRSCLEP